MMVLDLEHLIIMILVLLPDELLVLRLGVGQLVLEAVVGVLKNC